MRSGDEDLSRLERAAAVGDALDVERYHAALTRRRLWGPKHLQLARELEAHCLERGGKKAQEMLFWPGRSWRDKARPIVRFVLARTRTWPKKEQKRAIHDAYPFGQRKMHPYKIWLDELARQTGGKRQRDRSNRPMSAGAPEATLDLFASNEPLAAAP